MAAKGIPTGNDRTGRVHRTCSERGGYWWGYHVCLCACMYVCMYVHMYVTMSMWMGSLIDTPINRDCLNILGLVISEPSCAYVFGYFFLSPSLSLPLSLSLSLSLSPLFGFPPAQVILAARFGQKPGSGCKGARGRDQQSCRTILTDVRVHEFSFDIGPPAFQYHTGGNFEGSAPEWLWKSSSRAT